MAKISSKQLRTFAQFGPVGNMPIIMQDNGLLNITQEKPKTPEEILKEKLPGYQSPEEEKANVDVYEDMIKGDDGKYRKYMVVKNKETGEFTYHLIDYAEGIDITDEKGKDEYEGFKRGQALMKAVFDDQTGKIKKDIGNDWIREGLKQFIPVEVAKIAGRKLMELGVNPETIVGLSSALISKGGLTKVFAEMALSETFKPYEKDNNIYVAGKKVNVTPVEKQILSDIFSADDRIKDNSALKSAGASLLGFMINLPFMAVGAEVGGGLAGAIFPGIESATTGIGKFAYDAFKTFSAFQALDAPTQIQHTLDGAWGALADDVIHNALISIFFTGLEYPTRGISKLLLKPANASTSEIAQVLRRNKPLLENIITGMEMGLIGGLQGNTTEEKVANALTFMGMHFMNSYALVNFLKSKTKNVMIEDGAPSRYWYLDNNELYRIDNKDFIEKGKVTKLDGYEPISYKRNADKFKFIGEVYPLEKVYARDAIMQEKARRIGERKETIGKFLDKKIFDKIENPYEKGTNDYDKFELGKDMAKAQLITKMVTEKVGKQIAKNKLPDDADIHNIITKVAEEGDYISTAEWIVNNLPDYITTDINKLKKSIEFNKKALFVKEAIDNVNKKVDALDKVLNKLQDINQRDALLSSVDIDFTGGKLNFVNLKEDNVLLLSGNGGYFIVDGQDYKDWREGKTNFIKLRVKNAEIDVPLKEPEVFKEAEPTKKVTKENIIENPKSIDEVPVGSYFTLDGKVYKRTGENKWHIYEGKQAKFTKNPFEELQAKTEMPKEEIKPEEKPVEKEITLPDKPEGTDYVGVIRFSLTEEPVFITRIEEHNGERIAELEGGGNPIVLPKSLEGDYFRIYEKRVSKSEEISPETPQERPQATNESKGNITIASREKVSQTSPETPRRSLSQIETEEKELKTDISNVLDSIEGGLNVEANMNELYGYIEKIANLAKDRNITFKKEAERIVGKDMAEKFQEYYNPNEVSQVSKGETKESFNELRNAVNTKEYDEKKAALEESARKEAEKILSGWEGKTKSRVDKLTKDLMALRGYELGYTDKEIANILGRSKYQIKYIRQKYGIAKGHELPEYVKYFKESPYWDKYAPSLEKAMGIKGEEIKREISGEEYGNDIIRHYQAIADKIKSEGYDPYDDIDILSALDNGIISRKEYEDFVKQFEDDILGKDVGFTPVVRKINVLLMANHDKLKGKTFNEVFDELGISDKEGKEWLKSMGLNADNKFHSIRDLDKTHKPLDTNEKDIVAKQLANSLQKGWKVVTDENLNEAGLTNLADKVIVLGKYATEATPHHELLHYAVHSVGDEKIWQKMLDDTGLKGIEAHEKLAEEYSDYAVKKSKGEINPVWEKVRNLFKMISNWLRGRGFYAKADYFRKLYEGKLEDMPNDRGFIAYDMLTNTPKYIADLMDENAITKFYQYKGQTDGKDVMKGYGNTQDEFDTAKEEGLTSDLVRVDKKGAESIFYANRFRGMFKKIAEGWRPTVRRIWDLWQPPTGLAQREHLSKFGELYSIIQDGLVRKYKMKMNEILTEPKDETGKPLWENGRKFRELEKDEKQELLGAFNKEWDLIYYTGAEVPTWEDFIKKYSFNDKQKEVIQIIRNVFDKSVEVAKDGMRERLMELTKPEALLRIATKKELDALKKKYKFTADDFTIQWLQNNPDIKGELVNTIVDRYYDFDKNKLYFPSVRPANFKYYHIRAWKESNNPQLATKKFMNIKAGTVIEYKGQNYTVTKDVGKKDTEVITQSPDNELKVFTKDELIKEHTKERIFTYAKNKRQANDILARLRANGYKIEKDGFYRIKDIMNRNDYARLSEEQLKILADAGHISYFDPVMQKLFDAIKHGKFIQHTIQKSFVPGMHWTPEEFEKQIEGFVRLAVSDKYRQNVMIRARNLFQDWDTNIASRILRTEPGSEIVLPDGKSIKVTPDLIASTREEKEMMIGYINQMMFSDHSSIENLRGLAATYYTALKVSFLTQQALQNFQTTYPLLVAYAQKHNVSLSEANRIFGESFKAVADMALYLKHEGEGLEYKSSIINDEFIKLYKDLQKAAKINKTGLRGKGGKVSFGDITGGMTQELFALEEGATAYYDTRVSKALQQFMKYVNIASAGIEKATRVQSAYSFYKFAKMIGIDNYNDLFKFVADRIDDTMSQWGAAGRPLLFVNRKKLGVKQSKVIKALDKAFFTFKTFGTHNVALYETMMRNRLWNGLAMKGILGFGLHGIIKFPLIGTVFAIGNMFLDNDPNYEVLKTLDYLDDTNGIKWGSIMGRGIGAQFGIDASNLLNEPAVLPTDIYSETRGYTVEGKLANVMLGAPYGIVKDELAGAEAIYGFLKNKVLQDGLMTEREKKRTIKNLFKMTPLFVRNIASAMTLKKDGLEVQGQTLIKSQDLTWEDVIYKLMSFQPLKLVKAYEARFEGSIAKVNRLEGKIRELKRIRKEDNNLTRDDRYKIADMIRQAQKEIARLKWTKEYKQYGK